MKPKNIIQNSGTIPSFDSTIFSKSDITSSNKSIVSKESDKEDSNYFKFKHEVINIGDEEKSTTSSSHSDISAE